jgi:hypothetical protein
VKIAIVDDVPVTLESMRNALVAQGHEVLSILCRNTKPQQGMQVQLSVNGVANALNSFKPDYVLLDHFLDLAGKATGAHVAKVSKIPRDRLVGTEVSLIAHQILYCSDNFNFKEGIQDDPELREMFVKMFEPI